ncbi:MAG: carboxylesterase family protein [Acidimicrobiales bacterium]|nr:carboxylesterase family protein [Acidimicrobiales bacterium]
MSHHHDPRSSGPLARTALGVLRGVQLDGDGDGAGHGHGPRIGVAHFRGVPFAAPARRWRPPEPPRSWAGERDATRWAPDCPQRPWEGDATRATALAEDCLTLNIWTPSCDPAARLPVLVWFYGGSYLFGSATDPRCDGAAFAAKGVVLVTANYRVGLFGFLSHPQLSAESPHGSSGNYGLLDSIAALRWVREHIEAFGGDAANVTAFGVSAGAASLSLLACSPLAAGCFDKLILQSPGAFRPLASPAESDEAGLAVGEDIAALRALPWTELLDRTGRLVPKVRALTAPRVLRPIRDGWVIPLDERDAYACGRFHAVPTLVGTNADEGTKLTAGWSVEREGLLRADFAHDPVRALASFPTVADAFGDSQFNLGARGVARAMAAAGQPTWRYVFTRRRPDRSDGPDHGDEVPYVFGRPGHGGLAADERDRSLAEAMQDAWIRFASGGDPNGAPLVPWPRYDPAGDAHLDFGDDIRIGTAWRREPLDFLDDYLGTH